MIYFDESKSLLENLYFLSGPLLFIIALYGLKQINVAKKSLHINCKRESAILAFELSQRYIENLTDDYETLTDLFQALHIDYIKLEELDLTSLEIIERTNKNISEYDKAKSSLTEFKNNITSIMDKLEGYAVPFIAKIADEEIAYNLDGKQFLYYCNLCAVGIHSARENDEFDNNLYRNTIELYHLWKNRFERHKIDNQENSWKKNWKNIRKIKPLGVNN